jgi:DnaJ-class molecular chaperone
MHPPALPAITFLALVTLCYLLRGWLRPFKTCRRCRGYGRIPSRTGRGRPRPCPRCKGHGVKPRATARARRHARRTIDDARR